MQALIFCPFPPVPLCMPLCVQFDTYRWMRRLNQDDWSSSCLATNCLWVAYLAEMIVKEKASACNGAHKRQLREFRLVPLMQSLEIAVP